MYDILHAHKPLTHIAVAFSMYDLDGNGFITKEEMARIMDSFYKLVGPLVTFSGKKYESPQQLVDEFFDQMDFNKDGQIRYSVRVHCLPEERK